jgi:hypothetical protein
MVVFAASLLGVAGIFNLIDGIAAVARSHVFVANAHYVIGDLRTWGWVALILGVLVPDDRRRGRGGAVGPVRPRKPREHTRLTRPGQAVPLLTMLAVTCPIRPQANPIQASH